MAIGVLIGTLLVILGLGIIKDHNYLGALLAMFGVAIMGAIASIC